jgi:hypothetical protein
MPKQDPALAPGVSESPGGDLDATFLWLRFRIGDENDPDDVIEIKVSGDFRIDDALRDEIRSLPLKSDADLTADDVEMRERQIRPMGTGQPIWFDILVQAQMQGLPANAVGAAIWDGCKALVRRLRSESTTAEIDADQAHTYAPPPEQQLLN